MNAPLHSSHYLQSILMVSFLFLCTHHLPAEQMRVEKVPEGGVQPQVAVDGGGRVHLVYLLGEAARGCDVRYTIRRNDLGSWEPSRTVNSEARSAVAMGTIRGARLAVGLGGSVHVVWNGRPANGKGTNSPLLYARLDPVDTVFSQQADLLAGTEALDGGADISTDGEGRVSIVWHGQRRTGTGESFRLIFARHSTDDGRTFGPLIALNEKEPGVCACCSLSARILQDGTLGVLFRGASQPDQRGMIWLTQPPSGPASLQRLDEWKVNACPMSSAAILVMKQPLLAWENAGRITLARPPFNLNETYSLDLPHARHPALAQNKAGQILVACASDSGWAKAGQIEWRLLDASLKKVITSSATRTDLPVWSFPATFALPDDSFILLQ